MKKKLSILLCLSLCLGLLSGCMGIHAETKINADGSGIITASMGISENAAALIKQADENSDIYENTKFELNGKTYYGEVETREFGNLSEFNALMEDMNDNDDEDGVKSGEFKLSQDGNKLYLTVTVFDDTGSTDAIANDLGEDAQALPPDALEILNNDMAIVYDFEFPYNVIQTSGPINGISLVGNKLTVNLIEMKPVQDKQLTYVFMSSPDVAEVEIPPVGILAPPVKADKFSDVISGSWYCDAVNAVAEGGLVNGIGDGTFNPTGELTYSAFCQIIAKASSMATGARNGYWAYDAIDSCIRSGWLDSKNITPENFDIPITREAAFAIAARALNEVDPYGEKYSDIRITDIPDFEQIDNAYGSYVYMAYRYGLTKGVDGVGTFNPTGLLSRAELCQMLYNVGWMYPRTAAMKC